MKVSLERLFQTETSLTKEERSMLRLPKFGFLLLGALLIICTAAVDNSTKIGTPLSARATAQHQVTGECLLLKFTPCTLNTACPVANCCYVGGGSDLRTPSGEIHCLTEKGDVHSDCLHNADSDPCFAPPPER